jgi:hypothetical protein
MVQEQQELTHNGAKECIKLAASLLPCALPLLLLLLLVKKHAVSLPSVTVMHKAMRVVMCVSVW